MSAQDDKAREIADAFAPFNRAIKSAHSLILNRLNQMQRAPYYATAHDELALAECSIGGRTGKHKGPLRDIVWVIMSAGRT